MAKQENVAAKVKGFIEAPITEAGYSLWDVEYVKEGVTRYLRVTIEAEGRDTDIEDCVRVNDIIDPILDKEDPISESYTLEVSSPGIERSIRLPFHYIACAGKKALVRLYAPVGGKKEFVGILGCNEDASVITLKEGAQSYVFSRAQIAQARLVYDF